jgi:hypothetical protein
LRQGSTDGSTCVQRKTYLPYLHVRAVEILRTRLASLKYWAAKCVLDVLQKACGRVSVCGGVGGDACGRLFASDAARAVSRHICMECARARAGCRAAACVWVIGVIE